MNYKNTHRKRNIALKMNLYRSFTFHCDLTWRKIAFISNQTYLDWSVFIHLAGEEVKISRRDFTSGSQWLLYANIIAPKKSVMHHSYPLCRGQTFLQLYIYFYTFKGIIFPVNKSSSNQWRLFDK